MKAFLLFHLVGLSLALADGPAKPAAPAAGGGAAPYIPLLIILGIFYFLILRPQQKKAKLHQSFLTSLKKGDMVITNAGIIGTVKLLGDKIVTLEIDNQVSIKILRSQIAESANTLKEEPKAKAPLFAKPQEETK